MGTWYYAVDYRKHEYIEPSDEESHKWPWILGAGNKFAAVVMLANWEFGDSWDGGEFILSTEDNLHDCEGTFKNVSEKWYIEYDKLFQKIV